MLKRDTRGWRIPTPGSRSAQIYAYMVNGLKPADIKEKIGGSSASIRTHISRIKEPDKHNERVSKQRKRVAATDDDV